MKNFIKSLVFLPACLLFVSTVSLPAASALDLPAAQPRLVAASSQDAACKGLDQLGGTSCTVAGNSNAENKVGRIGNVVVNIISLIAGIMAVIMIMVSGFRYITSGGDSNKVSAAKHALIYALIGLAIVGLSQILIRLVLSTAAGA